MQPLLRMHQQTPMELLFLKMDSKITVVTDPRHLVRPLPMLLLPPIPMELLPLALLLVLLMQAVLLLMILMPQLVLLFPLLSSQVLGLKIPTLVVMLSSQTSSSSSGILTLGLLWFPLLSSQISGV
jgi:hypothetical protein